MKSPLEFWRNSLRVKLLTSFLLIGLLPLAILGVLAFNRSRDSLIAGQGAFLEAQAAAAVNKIDRNLFERYGDVQAFAFHPKARGTREEIREAADFYTVNYGIYDLMIVADLEGKILGTNSVDATGQPLPDETLIGRSVTSEEWYQAIRSGQIIKGKTWYSDLMTSPLVAEVHGGRGLSLIYAAPVFDAGGNLSRIWCNFASPERIVREIMVETRQTLANLGVESAATLVLNHAGLVIDDAVDSHVLNYNFLKAGLEAAKDVIHGKSGFRVEPLSDGDPTRIIGYSPSTGALGYTGKGWSALITQDIHEALSPARELAWFSFMTAAVAALVIILVAVFLTRGIVRPVAASLAIFEDLASGDGDLTQRVAVETRDEIGRMGHSFNEFMNKLHTVIGDVRSVVAEVNGVSQDLSNAAGQLADASHEQASGLQETAASCEQLSGTVANNAENARQARELAAASSELAGNGGQVVLSAVDAMNGISESSTRIGEIIGTIDEIAFQTNMLALNAAVEAARAGEQGRGFAVVAAEVRLLAQRSAVAAKEIKTLVHESRGRVESGTELVARSGSTLSEIVASSKRVTSVVSEIASASNEQAVGIKQVATAVAEMDSVTQRSTQQNAELAASAAQLASQASQLESLVARFRL